MYLFDPPLKSADLDYHKLSGIKFTTIKLNYPHQTGKNAKNDIQGREISQGIHILYTDKGAYGWGVNRGTEQMLKNKFTLIRGKPVSEILIPASGVTSSDMEVFDFSLFDLAGKILNKPVYRLLGKRRPEKQLCYSGMIYFDDLDPEGKPSGIDRILEECNIDYNYGYRQFKLHIGRGYKWMEKEKGLQRDIEVTKMVSRNFPDCDILVDGNNGFTITEIIRYLEGIGDTKLFWIEEPFHETIEDYAKLISWLRVHGKNPLLADGATDPDEKVLTQLGSQRIINVFTEDIEDFGFTNWIRLINMAKQLGIMASPRAWGTAVKTGYIAHLAGASDTTATIEGVTCTSEDIDLTGYRLRNGKLILSKKPGFGMDLLKKI